MKKLASKVFWLDATERAIKTFAQTAVAMITVGQTFTEINWVGILSTSGVAALISVLTSVATLKEE